MNLLQYKYLYFVALLTFPIVASAQLLPYNWVQTNGKVNKIINDTTNNRLIVTGEFTLLKRDTTINSNSIITYDIGTANYTKHLDFDGEIRVCISDENGGLFVGGSFTTINGQVRKGIAQLDINGNLTSWNANFDFPQFNQSVYALELYGSKLYVGGYFNQVQGQNVNNFVVLNKSTAQIFSSSLASNNQVIALKKYNGFVYVAGNFSQFSCGVAGSVVRIDTTTALCDSWSPNVTGAVRSILFDNTYIYLGGNIQTVNGQARSGLARVSLSNGALDSWNPVIVGNNGGTITPQVYSMSLYGNELIIGGTFGQVNGQARTNLASIDLTSLNLTNWNPNLDSDVNSTFVQNDELFLGGAFFFINNQIHNNFAKIDLTTHSVQDWDPHISGTISYITSWGSEIVALGSYYLETYLRQGLASIDLITQTPTSWKPVLKKSGNYQNEPVLEMLLNDTVLYIGGEFDEVNGTARNNIASFNSSTYDLASWSPMIDSTVKTMCINNDSLIVGGLFTHVNGNSRNHIAAFNCTDGALNSIDLDANGNVNVIKRIGTSIYFGGEFDQIGGVQRFGMARFDKDNLQLDTLWQPKSNGKINTFCEYNQGILIGGNFTTINNNSRINLASVNPTTGFLNNLNIQTDDEVNYIGNALNRIFVLGSFNTIGGQNRPMLAELDPISELITPWYLPGINTPTGNFMLQLDSIVLFSGTWGMAFDSLSVPNYTLMPTNISSFVFPSNLNGCSGSAYFSTTGAPDFNYYVDSMYVGTSFGFSNANALCSGIHNLKVVNYFGDSTFYNFSIPSDSNYFLIDTLNYQTLNDLLGISLLNCSINYTIIDSVYISSGIVVNDSIRVVWIYHTTTGTTYSDTVMYPLTYGNGYYYLQVSNFCPNKSQQQSFTGTQSVYILDNTVLLNVNKNNIDALNFSLFPNPTSDQVTITMTANSANLRIYDIQGKMLTEQQVVSGSEVSLKEFETGVYLFEVISEGNRTVKRVVKN